MRDDYLTSSPEREPHLSMIGDELDSLYDEVASNPPLEDEETHNHELSIRTQEQTKYEWNKNT